MTYPCEIRIVLYQDYPQDDSKYFLMEVYHESDGSLTMEPYIPQGVTMSDLTAYAKLALVAWQMPTLYYYNDKLNTDPKQN